MCVGSPTAGIWYSSQRRPDNEFETDTHTWNTTGFEALAPPDPRYCLAATGRAVFTDASAS